MEGIDGREMKKVMVEEGMPEKRNNPNLIGTYKTQVFNAIMDTAIVSFRDRFTPETQDLLHDLSCLDPRSFASLLKSELPSGCMANLAKALQHCDSTITKSRLHVEIIELARVWDVMKLGRLDEYEHSPDHHDNSDKSDSDDDKNDDQKFTGNFGSAEHREHCRNCAGCVYLLLHEYNMLTNAFSCIGLAYKFLLTLSDTQVACERSFSALKIIKSRIRSVLSHDNLEAFMLMKCEYEIVFNIDNNDIIEQVAEHSQDYWSNLKY